MHRLFIDICLFAMLPPSFVGEAWLHVEQRERQNSALQRIEMVGRGDALRHALFPVLVPQQFEVLVLLSFRQQQPAAQQARFVIDVESR